MSTYTDLHNRIKENVTILRKPGSKDDGMSPQKVILINPENQFYGTFNGAMNIKGGTLSDLTLVGGTIDGTTIKNATFLDGDTPVSIGEIAASVSDHDQRLTQAEADIKTIDATVDGLSTDVLSTITSLSDEINGKIDEAVGKIEGQIGGAVAEISDLSLDVSTLSSRLDELSSSVLNGVVYKGELVAYRDVYDKPRGLFNDDPACCILEGLQKPLKNGWMWRLHIDNSNVSSYVTVNDPITHKTRYLGEGDYIIIKNHNPEKYVVVPDDTMIIDDFDVINAQDEDDAKTSMIRKLSVEVMQISAYLEDKTNDMSASLCSEIEADREAMKALSGEVLEAAGEYTDDQIQNLSDATEVLISAISSIVVAEADEKFVHKSGDSVASLTVDSDLSVGGSTQFGGPLSIVDDDTSLAVADDGISASARKISLESAGKVTLSTKAPLEIEASRLSANFKNEARLSVVDGLEKIFVNDKSIQSTLDDLSNALDAKKLDKDLGDLISSQITDIQEYVDELSGAHGSRGVINQLSDEISSLRQNEKFELRLGKIEVFSEAISSNYQTIGQFLEAMLEPEVSYVRNNSGYIVEFSQNVALSSRIIINDEYRTTIGVGDTIYVHELSTVESAPINIPFDDLTPYNTQNQSGNTFVIKAGVSRYEFEDQNKNLNDEISARVAADAYISAWIQHNFANTGEDNELTTTVLNQEISAKSGLSVDGAVYALSDLSAAKQLFVNNGQLAVANDNERTSVEAVADIVKINNALSASQDTVSVDFSKTVDSSLGVSITDICADLSAQIEQLSTDLSTGLSNEIEARKMDDEFLSNAISTKIWIEDRANDPSDISNYSDLSIVKIGKDEYEDLAIGPTRLCANVLYVVESDYVDAYGQEIKNVLSSTKKTNAATVGQVDDAASEAHAYADQICSDLSVCIDDNYVHVSGDTISGTLSVVNGGCIVVFNEYGFKPTQYRSNQIVTPNITLDIPSKLSNVYASETIASREWTTSCFYEKTETSSATEISNEITALSTALSNNIDTICADLSVAISSKIWIEDCISGTISGHSDLSVIKMSRDAYEEIAVGSLCSNVLYVVESDCINAYGETIQNVVMSDDPTESEAATQHYVLSVLDTKQDVITDIDNIRLSAQNALPAALSTDFVPRSAVLNALYPISSSVLVDLSSTSMVSDIVSSIVIIRDALSTLWASVSLQTAAPSIPGIGDIVGPGGTNG